MTAQNNRLASGGVVNRDAALSFTIDGQSFTGFAGDTAASAFLASGNIRVGNSIYLGRPRGVLSAGVEEPNAFVMVKGSHNESMIPATSLELEDGMELLFQDGIGTLDQRKDTAEYDKKHVFTDVLVIGAGPAGLAAASAAAKTGQRVMILEQDFALGGDLLSADATETVNGQPASEYLAAVTAELEATQNVTVLTRTSAFGSYDNNYVIALEKRVTTSPNASRQRLWHITAKRVVLAVGAMERQIVFANNDAPGVMLASAVRTYINRYGVLPGKNAVVFTTNDSAQATVRALEAAGANVTVVDARNGEAVVDVTSNGDRVTSVTIAPINELGDITGETREVSADLVAVSGGWSPTVNLHSQRQGVMHWNNELAGFIPEPTVKNQTLAGSVNGTYSLEASIAEGKAAGETEAASSSSLEDRIRIAGTTLQLWSVAAPNGEWDQHFVDPQRDNTAKDILRATGAGMRSIEHVKRYTSISTGVDQGKIGGVNTIGILTRLLKGEDARAIAAGQPGQDASGGAESGLINDGGEATEAKPKPVAPGLFGTTTFRAPFTPVAFAALAGRSVGELYDPARTTAAHSWHVAHGAKFEDVGQWKRPWFYPQGNEDMDQAVARECIAARESVAMMDASTLGKIEIRGKDAAEFLNRMYTNPFLKLPVGKARYGIMCSPDGMIFDDGVTLRLAEDRFFMTTTTGGAAKVLDWLEEWSQTEWPELDVFFSSVTEQWATTAVVGPKSREVIAKLAPGLDVSKEGFGFMEFRETVLASGIPARICRITFSGELAYEVNVPTTYGLKVWEDIVAAGEEFNITPYGTETMHVLRAEKAYPIVGQDTDGTVTPQDLNMEWIIGKNKEFVGKRSFARLSHTDHVRKQWVSVLPVDKTLRLPEGTQIVRKEDLGSYDGTGLPSAPIPMVGHVTSSYDSQALGRTFGLALLKDGLNLIGTQLVASFDGRFADVEVGNTVLFDPEGARRDG